MPRPSCACGCGRPPTGKRSQQFYADVCRKRSQRSKLRRSATPLRTASERPHKREETRTKGAPALRHHPEDGGVTLLDTDAHCSGCGALMPALRGLLPVRSYCRDCVGSDACRCLQSGKGWPQARGRADYCCRYHAAPSPPWPHRFPDPWRERGYLGHLKETSYCAG